MCYKFLEVNKFYKIGKNRLIGLPVSLFLFERRNAIVDLDILKLKRNKTKRENILLMHLIKKNKVVYFKEYVFEEKFVLRDILDYLDEDICFEDCSFYLEADFSKVELYKDLEFRNCLFIGSVLFEKAVFYSDFKISGCKFNRNYIEQKPFSSASFRCQNVVFEGNKDFPRLDGILLGDSRFLFKDSIYNVENSEIARVNYTIARLQAEKINDIKNTGYYTYYERRYIGELIDKNDFNNYSEYLISKLLATISRVFIGYGEHISRLFFTMIFVISLFAFFYMNVGVITCLGSYIKLNILDIGRYSILELISIYIKFWYFSFMTFSTVGFGDMAVNTALGEILVCIEVFIGVVIQSVLAALIIKRMFK